MDTDRTGVTILLVDDERLFLQSLSEGLQSLLSGVRILTAGDGQAAVEVLEREAIDVLVTDVKMPVMDGFELLAWVSRHRPSLPTLVMTAFGTPDLQARLEHVGISTFVEKPIDLRALATRLVQVSEGATRGFVSGIPLGAFLQVMEMERKSCTLSLHLGGKSGLLHIQSGVLIDAETEGLVGEDAAAVIASWPAPTIEILPGPRSTERRVRSTLTHLLLEAARVEDELRRRHSAGATDMETSLAAVTEKSSNEAAPLPTGKEADMSASEKLKDLATIEGYLGAGVFTPTGESMAFHSSGVGFNKDIGVLANNVLMNAQKASLDMGTGRGQMVHVEAERAHILVRCCNEGTDPLKSQPGKAHIHVVLVLKDDAAIGLAKMKLNSAAEKLAVDFRL